MKDELSNEEWQKIRKTIFNLFDLTWEYAELSAKNSSENLPDSKPQRYDNEPFSNYNQRMLDWDKTKSETYSKSFSESKSKSFNMVKELEEYLQKLGMPDK